MRYKQYATMFTYYIMFTSIWMSVSGDSQLVIHNDSIVNDNYDQRVQCSQSLVENLTQTKQDNCTVEYNHLQNTKIDSLKGIILAETRKCCAEGYTLNRTSIEQCVYYNRSLPKLPFTSYNRSESKIQCEWDFHVFDPSKFVDHKFKIDDSGHLLVEKGHYQEFRNSQNYCIDGAVDRKGHLTDIAVTCMSREMYLLRLTLRSIFPWLHFFSALLLFMTMIAQIILHCTSEKSCELFFQAVVSFLVCMIIVQTEYGVIYAIPYQAHTWCFEKVHISGIFRLASSTWITVLGFHVWRKICCNEQLTNKEMIRRVIIYVLYAWGVPLALYFSAQVYLAYKIPPLPPGKKLCWFGNQVVFGIMTHPNVILVGLNLVFFIPAAIKVYNSRSVLAEANAHSHFQAERMEAVMRLIILMEFYLIPRIIHEIVDANFVSPYFLLISVAIYLTIGPFAFSFFVMKGRNRQRLASIWNKSIQKMRTRKPIQQTNSNSSTSSNLPPSFISSFATSQVASEADRAKPTRLQMPAHVNQAFQRE